MIGCDAIFSPQRITLHPSTVFEVASVVNARTTTDAQTVFSLTHKDGASLAKEVDIGRQPPTEVRLSEGVDSLVVAANQDG